MKKIIVMTGSFNPVSKAHFRILSDAVDRMDADEGVFVTTSDAYLEKKILLGDPEPATFILPGTVRTEMLRSLTGENLKLSCWGTELGGAQPQTCKTFLKVLRDKQKAYPGEEIRIWYLAGADKLRHMSHWRDADAFFGSFEFLFYERGVDMDRILESDPFLLSHRDRIRFLNVDGEDLGDVSSTEIRRRFFSGKDYRDLMDEGPWRILSGLAPADFPPPTTEDRIRAQLRYGGRFAGRNARLMVYKTNAALFRAWKEPFLGDRDAHIASRVYRTGFQVHVPERPEPTAFGCENADCADVAERMVRNGLRPAILNLASRVSPGGGYHKGAEAQEESLCLMSTLSQPLYTYGNPKYKHIRTCGVPNVPGVYPMDLRHGGIWAPCVTFFRHNAAGSYALRKDPFDCPVISVASLSNREKNDYAPDERGLFDEDGRLTQEGREIQADKIRTVFRIALDNGRDSLVLGAFGCGVYHLRCDEVAGLFREILSEDEFRNRFREIVFAILEGRPSARRGPVGREGKYAPFYELFG